MPQNNVFCRNSRPPLYFPISTLKRDASHHFGVPRAFLARAECTAARPGSAWSHDLDLPGRWPGGFEWCTYSPSAEDVCANPTPPGFELREHNINVVKREKAHHGAQEEERERVCKSSSQQLHDYAYDTMCMHTTITYIAYAHKHCVNIHNHEAQVK